MFSIISSYYNDKRLYENYWERTIIDNPNIEFIFVDDFSQTDRAEDCVSKEHNVKVFYVKEDKKFNSHGAKNLGVSKSSNSYVFMTDMDALPTTGLLEVLGRVSKTNTLIWPLWDQYKPSRFAGTPCPNEFSVHRDKWIQIKGYDEEVAVEGGWFGDWWARRNYINTFSPEVIHIGTCLFLEEDNGDRGNLKVRDRELENKIKRIVDERNKKQDYSRKPFINFEWERVI